MNKTAIITGGSRGLGKNTVLKLAEKGVDIIFTYHSNKDAALEVIKEAEALGIKIDAIRLDVSVSGSFDDFTAEVKRVLTRWEKSRFDYLVNNGGSGENALFTETTEELFDSMVNMHLKGPFFLTQKLLPIMNDGGRIVNITSGLTRFSMQGVSAYAIMKTGLEAMTRYIAKELGNRQITAISFAPGAIETDFGGGAVRDVKDVNDVIASVTALGRAGKPDDIGGAVATLLSGDCSWINGERIEASGGMFL